MTEGRNSIDCLSIPEPEKEMPMAILGDVHANREALDQALWEVDSRAISRIFHVGDLVGYCTDPNYVVQVISQRTVPGVIGNHEQMTLKWRSDKKCPGRDAIRYTQACLGSEEMAYISSLPRILRTGELVFFHASPDDEERYLSTENLVAQAGIWLDDNQIGWKIAFHGHTHKQRIFEYGAGMARMIHEGPGRIQLDPARKYVVSVGSVGVSRDFNPNGALTLFDPAGFVDFLRFGYDFESTARKIDSERLATKLFRTAGGQLNHNAGRGVLALLKLGKRVVLAVKKAMKVVRN